MAEMRSPIQGGIDQARRSFSASSLGGGAIVPYNPAVAAENNASRELLQRNEVTLQQINSSVLTVGSQMNQLNNNLISISNLVTQSSQLEAQEAQQKNKQENMLAQQQLREGKESLIERKIQSALQKPVQKIGAKAQFALGGLMNFFNQLFFGWLLYQGIETISALSEGNTEKLNQIKDNVLENLTKVGSVLFFLNGGLFTIINGLGRVGLLFFRIGRLGIIRKPFIYLWNILTGIGKRLAKILPPSVRKLIRLGAGGGLASPANLLGLGVAAGATYLQTKENVEQGMEPVPAAVDAATPAVASAAAGALTKGPWWLKAFTATAAFVGTEYLQDKGIINLSSMFSSGQEQMDGGEQFTTDTKREVNAVEQPGGDTTKPQQMKAAEISSAPRSDTTKQIGPEPEPAPTIAFLPAAAPVQKTPSVPAALGEANRIAKVSPGNSDNFYRAFSQTQYQVV
jgi:hypothetical protein